MGNMNNKGPAKETPNQAHSPAGKPSANPEAAKLHKTAGNGQVEHPVKEDQPLEKSSMVDEHGHLPMDPNAQDAPEAGLGKIEEPSERPAIIPPEKFERASSGEEEGGEKLLTLDEIEKMEKPEAGAPAAGAEGDGGFSLPGIIEYGRPGHVDSVPRDLGLGGFSFGVDKIVFPVLSEAPAEEDLLPNAVDDDTGANGEALIFFEKALPDGTDPGSSSLIISGNILANDNLGNPPVTILDLTMPGFTTDKSNPQVWTINTNYGVLTLYVADTGGHQKGDFTYELVDNLLHPADAGANQIIDSFEYIFADNDGDQASANIIVKIVDDVPLIEVSRGDAAVDPLMVDETHLNINATANFADNFIASHHFGADGPGAFQSLYSLSIAANGVNSGLIDGQSGQAVLLFMNADVVEGRTSEGLLVFTLAVDDTGLVTLDQIRTLQHPDPTNPDDPITLGDADLIHLTRTDLIVDADEDSNAASATIDLSQALIFKDDGPHIDVTVVAQADLLTVDETDLNTNVSANFADNFNAIFNFGADGAGSVASHYALSIPADGTDSGLIDVATGEHVLLYMDNGVVEGRISGDVVVFTVSVDDSGTVTLDQIRALQHPNTSNPDDAVTLADANMVTLTRTDTIIDKDGDSALAAATIDLGKALIFKDDGPHIELNIVAAADNLTVDESNLNANASANFADNFSNSYNFGADGAGSVSSAYSLSIASNGVNSGLVDVATGQAVQLFMNGGVVEGRIGDGSVVFTVSVDANGVVTLDQIRALQHPNTSNPDDAVTLAAADLIQLTRTDTIIDRDGDPAFASETLDIGQALSFKDDGPSIDVAVIAAADNLVVDETNLNLNASANFADNFSSLHNFGADNAGSVSSAYSLSIASNGVNSGLIDVASGQAVQLFMNGGVVEGRIGDGTVVFTVSVDANGVVTLDQIRALQHPNTSNPDDAVTLAAAELIQLTRTDTIIDRDGDSAFDSASLNIGQALIFKDDGPSINISIIAAADALVVDETHLGNNASANFADNFSIANGFGADGAGSFNGTFSLSIASNGVNSGLFDVASGQAVQLFMNGGVVEGRISDGTVVFTVSVDANGTVTLDQIRALQHPNTSNPDDAVTLSNANLIQLTLTGTLIDKDGDAVQGSATLNIGQALSFKDDGPSIDVSIIAPPDALVVDETNLGNNASANFADNFSSLHNFGADNAGSVSSAYSLSIASNGVNSGLVDVATGQAVQLFMNGGVVEGRIGDGTVVFTVSVDANGTVTLDQIRALQHPNTSNPDDAVTLAAADLIKLTRTDTVIDRDGDPAFDSATLNIGQALSFKDDGPSIDVSIIAAADNLVVDETNLNLNASANFADNFSSIHNFGADNGGSVSSAYSLSIASNGVNSGLVDVASGQNVQLFMNGGVVEGRIGDGTVVFTVSVDANGTVTLDQIRALQHPNTSNPDDAVTLAAADLIQLTRTDTIIDRDGDSAFDSATLNIGQALTFKDDGPNTNISVIAAADALVVDETHLGINASANFADNFNAGNLFGADGAGSFNGTFSLSIASNGVNSGLVDVASGQAVQLFMNGGVVEGRIGDGTVVFTVSVDANGTVTLDQIRALQHPNTSNPDDAVTLSNANLIQLTLTGTIIDKDGDAAQGSATLNIGQALSFKDDGPSIDVSIIAPPDALVVDETNLGNNASANFADNFSSIHNFGADNAGSVSSAYSLSIASNGVNSGLIDVASGQAVQLFMNGGVVEGRISNGTVVFTVSVDANGTVTLDQIRALQHPNTSNPDDAVTLSNANLIQLTRTDTIIDRDGDAALDSATLNIGQSLTFKDDGPSIDVSTIAAADNLVVDETNLNLNASANFADNFSSIPNFGADNAGSVSSAYSLSIASNGVNSGLIDVASGQNVQLFMNGGVVEGRISGGTVVFTVSVDANGTVTLDQIRALQHPNTSNPDDAVTLAAADLIKLTRTDTIIDRDGDSAFDSATLNIGQALTFKDDGPSISVTIVAAADNLLVDETNLAANASANFADNFKVTSNFGADGAGNISHAYTLAIASNGANSGLIDTATGQAVQLFMNGNVVEGRISGGIIVFTVSVNASGVVTLDQQRAVAHPDATNPDDPVTLSSANLIQFIDTATITDKDGDSVSSSGALNIGQALTFEDDGPKFLNLLDPDQDNIVEINMANPDSTTTQNVQLADWNYGADGSKSSPTLVSSSGDGNIVYNAISPNQVELKFYDANNNLVAVLTLNANGTDSLQVMNRPNTILSDQLLTGEAQAGGPGIYFVDSTIAPDLTIRITANDGDGISEPNSDDQVNPSTQGWAVDNNIIEVNETIKFESLNENTFAPIALSNFTFDTTGFTGGQSSFDIRIKVYYNDGTSEIFNINSTEGQTTSVKDLAGFNTGSLIYAVEVTNADTTPGGSVGFRLNNVTIFTESQEPPPDLDYSFQLKVVDGDNDPVTQDFSLHLDGDGAGGTVYESGLASGSDLDPNNPNPPAQPQPVLASGNIFETTTPSNDATKVSFNNTTFNAVNGVITVNTTMGQFQYYTQNVGNHAKGDYSYTLLDNTSHPNAQGNNEIFEKFTLLDANNNAVAPALNIAVVDDVPIAIIDNAEVVKPPLPKYNLIFTLDVSGSMDTVIPNTGGKTRLDLLKAALISNGALLDSYDAASSDVKVTIVTFSGDLDGQNSDDAQTSIEFSNIQAAKDYINDLDANGWTNYRAAIQATSNAITQDANTPALNDYIDRVYFLSDGKPQPNPVDDPGFNIDNRLTNAEEAAWRNLLNNNNVEAYILNIGGLSAADVDNHLEDLDDDHTTEDTGIVFNVAPDLSNLEEILVSTIDLPTITGNLLANDVQGADGIHITEISFNLSTDAAAQQYLSAHPELAGATRSGSTITIPLPNGEFVTPQGGLLTVNANGDYTYKIKETTQLGNDQINYKVVDGDGDQAASHVIFDVTDGVNLNSLNTFSALTADGVEDHNIVSTAGQHQDTVTLQGTDNIDEYIIHVDDLEPDQTILVKDLGIDKQSILTFAGVQDSNADGKTSLSDFVDHFHQDGNNVEMTLTNQSTVVLENVGTVAGTDVAALEQHLSNVTQELHVIK